MNILGVEIRLAKQKQRSTEFPALNGILNTQGIVGRTPVTEKTALGLSAYWAGVRLISEAIARLPVDVIQRQGNTRTQIDHPAEYLLNAEANYKSTSFDFLQILIANAINWGNGIAVIERDNFANPVELVNIPPKKYEPIEYDQELWWRIKLENSKDVLVNDRDVINIRGFGTGEVIGLSAIEYHKQNLGLSIAAQDYGQDFYNKGSRIDGYLQYPGKLERGTKDEIAEHWRANYGPNGKRGVAILDQGTQYHHIGMPPEQAQFIETRKFQKEEIATILNIPAHMINMLDRATNNNIQHQGIEFVTYCLGSWIEKLEQEYRRKLLKESEKTNHVFKHNVNSLLRTDAKTQAEHFRLMLDNGIYSINDVRALLDLNPIDNGNGYYVQLNRIPVEQIGEYYKSNEQPKEQPRLSRAGYDPNQPRDEEGKWTSGGSGSDEELTDEEKKKNFKEWFADSKVVDENGEPLVVYHGSTEKIEEFSTDLIDEDNVYGDGFYFTNKKEYAARFGGEVVEVYLSSQKMFIVDDNNPEINGTNSYLSDMTDAVEFSKEVRANGYDGIKVVDNYNGRDEYIVFNPNQIKSATDNNGNYSKDSKKITE